MPTLTIELPPQRLQTEFNLRRWAELLADRAVARIEGRIETDRSGHVIMSHPPARFPEKGTLPHLTLDRRKDLPFGRDWNGKIHATKQVCPVFVDEAEGFIVVPVYTYYF